MKLDEKELQDLFIDDAGKKLQLTVKATGELHDVEVFVAILPSSLQVLTNQGYRLKNQQVTA